MCEDFPFPNINTLSEERATGCNTIPSSDTRLVTLPHGRDMGQIVMGKTDPRGSKFES